MQENCPKAKESAATEVLAILERTAARAEKTCALVSERTSSIARPESQPCVGDKNETQSYPPLFGRINELADSINRSLAGIEDIMRRCEL